MVPHDKTPRGEAQLRPAAWTSGAACAVCGAHIYGARPSRRLAASMARSAASTRAFARATMRSVAIFASMRDRSAATCCCSHCPYSEAGMSMRVEIASGAPTLGAGREFRGSGNHRPLKGNHRNRHVFRGRNQRNRFPHHFFRHIQIRVKARHDASREPILNGESDPAWVRIPSRMSARTAARTVPFRISSASATSLAE
jgi:hypothetical protein